MTRGAGTHQRWGKARYPRLKPAATVIAQESPCDCKPGKCEKAARECRDWIKRATNQNDKKGTA